MATIFAFPTTNSKAKLELPTQTPTFNWSIILRGWKILNRNSLQLDDIAEKNSTDNSTVSNKQKLTHLCLWGYSHILQDACNRSWESLYRCSYCICQAIAEFQFVLSNLTIGMLSVNWCFGQPVFGESMLYCTSFSY